MNQPTRIFLPVAIFLACAVAPLSAADALELKQRLITDKKYFQTTQTTQSMTMDIGPRKTEQKTTTTMEMSLAVRPHEDGTRKRVTIKYERVAMNMDMNGQKEGFDSAKPVDATDTMGLAKRLGGDVGKEVKVVLTSTDDIDDIENFYGKNPPRSPEPEMEMARMLKNSIIAHLMKQGDLHAMPGKPVRSGDSWPFTTTLMLPPPMHRATVKGTYTFKGMATHGGVPCAEIATVGEISLDQPKNDAHSSTSSGTLNGTVWFDPKLGFARDAQFAQEMNMTVKEPADPTFMLRCSLKQEVSITLAKVEDMK